MIGDAPQLISVDEALRRVARASQIRADQESAIVDELRAKLPELRARYQERRTQQISTGFETFWEKFCKAFEESLKYLSVTQPVLSFPVRMAPTSCESIMGRSERDYVTNKIVAWARLLATPDLGIDGDALVFGGLREELQGLENISYDEDLNSLLLKSVGWPQFGKPKEQLLPECLRELRRRLTAADWELTEIEGQYGIGGTVSWVYFQIRSVRETN